MIDTGLSLRGFLAALSTSHVSFISAGEPGRQATATLAGLNVQIFLFDTTTPSTLRGNTVQQFLFATTPPTGTLVPLVSEVTWIAAVRIRSLFSPENLPASFGEV